MSDKPGGGTAVAKRSPPRVRAGGKTYATLVERPVFRVQGQIYTRLLYTGYDPGPAYRGDSVPVTGDPIFHKTGIAYMASDYCLKDVELKITRGSKTLASTKSDASGRFWLEADLRANTSYNLEAVLSSDRIYSEKIVCELKVKEVPGPRDHGPQITKIDVKAKHYLNTATPKKKVNWEFSHEEKLAPVMQIASPAQLVFDLKGPLIFSTVSLKLNYLSQHPSPEEKKEMPFLEVPSNVPGESLAVLHQHMCLATCFAMLLQYYGIDKSRDDVVEMAAKVFVREAKTINGKWIWRAPGQKQGFQADLSETTKEGAKQLKLIPESGGSSKEARWPHNVVPLILRAVQPLLDKAKVGTKSTAAEVVTPLVNFTDNQDIWGMIGSGMPFIVVDKGSRDWDHGRVCHGVVIDEKGKIKTMYGNDPWDNNKWTIKTDGKESEMGWIAWGRVLKQAEVSPERLRSGGSLPAPARGSMI